MLSTSQHIFYAFIQHVVRVARSLSVSVSNLLLSHHSAVTLTVPRLTALLPDDWQHALPVPRTRVPLYSALGAHRPQSSSAFPLTVKDLLLSGTPEHVSSSAGSYSPELARLVVN